MSSERKKAIARSSCHPCAQPPIGGVGKPVSSGGNRKGLFQVVVCECGDTAVVYIYVSEKPGPGTLGDMIAALRHFIPAVTLDLDYLQGGCKYFHLHANKQ